MNRILRAIFVCLIHTAVSLGALDFVDVQGGGMTYTTWNSSGEEVHDVWVEDFRMADTEVTVAQWREFTLNSGMDFCWEGHYCGDIAELSPGENCPIQLVRIHEAAAYCNWRSEHEGLQPVYHISDGRILRDSGADGYRVPTTEEWDYAARGGRLSRGYKYAGSDEVDLVGWVNLPWEEGTKPVGEKLPNELGLFDMTGNIREWTWPADGIPENPDSSDEILHLRGGSWTTDKDQAVLSYDRLVWVYQWNPIGFRLARNADSSDSDSSKTD